VRENLTILLPVRNGLSYLSGAIKSIEANTRDGDQILVVDDGSEDGTREALEDWANSNGLVEILTNPGRGLVDALNYGVSQAKYEWIARFDVDDIYSDQRLAMQCANITPDSVAIFSDYEIVTNDGFSLGVIPSAISHPYVYLSLIKGSRTAHPSVLMKKSAVIGVGGYRQEDFPAEDLSLWIRLGRIGQLTSVPQSLLHYRLNGGSISATKRTKMLQKSGELTKQIYLSNNQLNDIYENLTDLKRQYHDSILGAQRRLLFFLDIWVLSRNQSNPKRFRFFLSLVVFNNPISTVKALLVLYIGKLRRRWYRKTLTQSSY